MVRPQLSDRILIVGPDNDGTHHSSDRIAQCPNRADNAGTANGRLIAAAPDLAEALQNLLTFIDTSQRDTAILNARAALEKAGL